MMKASPTKVAVDTTEETASEAMARLNKAQVDVGLNTKDAQVFTCDGKDIDFDLQNDQIDGIAIGHHSTQADKTAII